MTTDWIRKHVKPSLVTRYERAMSELRGTSSSAEHVVDNLYKLNEDSEKIESDAERRARAIAEDEADMQYYNQSKHNK